MGKAKVQAHLVQEIRLGQRNAPALEVARHIKRQPLGAGALTVVVKQGRIGAAVVVQHQ